MEMRTQLHQEILEMSSMLDKFQNKYEKLSKSKKKKTKQNKDKFLKNHSLNQMDLMHNIALQNFIASLFSIALENPLLKISLSYPTTMKEFTNYMLNDKQLNNFFNCLFVEETRIKNKEWFYLITFIFLFIFQNQKITSIKVKNFLSLLVRKSNMNFKVLSETSHDENILLEQIRTGIKYEKEKNYYPSNNTIYTKKKKHFSVISAVDRYIKIKYISKQEYKHRFHKSPKEHYRAPTVRHYKSGKRVHIKGCFVNKGCIN